MASNEARAQHPDFLMELTSPQGSVDTATRDRSTVQQGMCVMCTYVTNNNCHCLHFSGIIPFTIRANTMYMYICLFTNTFTEWLINSFASICQANNCCKSTCTCRYMIEVHVYQNERGEVQCKMCDVLLSRCVKHPLSCLVLLKLHVSC